jgi:acyl-CoA thioesterase FadM
MNAPDHPQAPSRQPARTDESSGRPASIVIERRVEWSDTDASGHYHNTAAFRLFETAETLLLARLGMRDDIYGRHPRARLEADFLCALRFHDPVETEVRVESVGRTSVTYVWEIRRGPEVCVRGRAVAVLLDRPGGSPVPWPEEYRRRFLSSGPQPPERLVDDA